MTPLPAVTVDAVVSPAVPPALVAAASALAGRPLVGLDLLAQRPDRDGAGDVVVALLGDADRPGDDVVAKAGPPALVAAGVRVQRCAHVVATAAGAGLGGDLAVPAVVAHDAAAGLVLMEHATGPTLADRFRRGDTGAFARVAAALAVLHTADGTGLLPARDLAGHLADLVLPQPDRLAATGLERRLTDLAAGTAGTVLAAAADHPALSRLVHRDVHPRQVLVDGGRTWLLDWDLGAAGDPALDLGNLVAGLRARHPGRTAEPAVEAFLAGYAAGDTCDALARVGVHEAFTYVRLACKRARLHGPAAAGAVEDLLTRARLTLAALP
jgi:aminoglycoside phosphotransferase (APT) family kinase protein